MADCECLAGCIFFNDKMANMPGLTDLYKANLCRGDKTACARYMVFKAKGRENVPPDLYPNDTARAKEMIAQ
jgi:hypothetical protein